MMRLSFSCWHVAMSVSGDSGLPQAPVPVNPWLFWALRPVHRLLMGLYFSRVTVRGLEHLPVTGPVILAPKHFSRWDPLVVGLLSRSPLRFMTRLDQFVGVQGWLIRQLGGFPVDVDRPRVATLRGAIAVLQAQQALVIFPEGGIERDQPLRTLKPGLARLVLQAEAGLGASPIPIIPIALHYSPDAIWRAKVTMEIAPPLYAADYRQATDKQTAQALTQALQQQLLERVLRLTAAGDDGTVAQVPAAPLDGMQGGGVSDPSDC
jgi:1-acyl-sn-glycerol-3-phosphate acyltransferase